MSNPVFLATPIVILGAARSGTKMLRRLIAAAGNVRAVPYDVNYIWRYGNQQSPHDVLDPASSNPRIVRFIQRQLLRCAGMSRFDSGYFVEKTVSNILRLPFVASVFPDVRCVVLIRDGRDVVESAYRCWRQPPNLGYLLAKCRTFPWLSCAGYGWASAKATWSRFARSKRTPTWGPRYPGIDQHVATLSLLEVCAHQWRCCMKEYDRCRDVLPADRRLEIQYERLVSNPEAEVFRLAEFLGLPAQSLQQYAFKNTRADNVGKHLTLTTEQQAVIEQITDPTLRRWGYECKSLARHDRTRRVGRAA